MRHSWALRPTVQWQHNVARHKDVCQPREKGFAVNWFIASPRIQRWQNYRGDYLNSISRETQSRVSHLIRIKNTWFPVLWHKKCKKKNNKKKNNTNDYWAKLTDRVNCATNSGSRIKRWAPQLLCAVLWFHAMLSLFTLSHNQQGTELMTVCSRSAWSKALFTLASFTAFTADWFLQLTWPLKLRMHSMFLVMQC